MPLGNNRILAGPLELRHRRVNKNWPQPGQLFWIRELGFLIPRIDIGGYDFCRAELNLRRIREEAWSRDRRITQLALKNLVSSPLSADGDLVNLIGRR
eukprot:1699618-Rhodomonas_salina.2